MIEKSAWFLLIFIIIIAILKGITNIENFYGPNQYITDLDINRDVINRELYFQSVLPKQDTEIYAFENNLMMQEESLYNTEKFDCKEALSDWSNCKATCDGYNKTVIGFRERNILWRYPGRNGGASCSNLTEPCSINNCIINKMTLCPEWFSDGIPTDHYCLVTNGGIYFNGGDYNRNFVNYADNAIVALILWKDNTAHWSGFMGIRHNINPGNQYAYEISNSENISVSGRWAKHGFNNIVISPQCDKYSASILVSKNDIETHVYPLNRIYPQPLMNNIYGIMMNGGMFGRNFIDNGDMCILALTMWTDTRKSWTGFVGVNHMGYPGQETFIDNNGQWKNDVDVWQGWDCCGANYIMFSGVNSDDINVYYKVNLLVSKNNFSTYTFPTIVAQWILGTGSVININKIINRNLISNNDQIILAIVIWTSEKKCWSGFIAINCTRSPATHDFRLLWNLYSQDNRNESLSLSSLSETLIKINNVSSSREIVYYRTSILNSKNKIQTS